MSCLGLPGQESMHIPPWTMPKYMWEFDLSQWGSQVSGLHFQATFGLPDSSGSPGTAGAAHLQGTPAVSLEPERSRLARSLLNLFAHGTEVCCRWESECGYFREEDSPQEMRNKPKYTKKNMSISPEHFWGKHCDDTSPCLTIQENLWTKTRILVCFHSLWKKGIAHGMRMDVHKIFLQMEFPNCMKQLKKEHKRCNSVFPWLYPGMRRWLGFFFGLQHCSLLFLLPYQLPKLVYTALLIAHFSFRVF